MKKPHYVKARTVRAHTVKGHEVKGTKAHWVKKIHVAKSHTPGHRSNKPYTTRKVVKTVHKPTKAGFGNGDLNMCALTAAGLVIGVDDSVNLAELYNTLTPADDGMLIPQAIELLGGVPVGTDLVSAGTILGYSLPDAFPHTVAVDELTDTGIWVWSWDELYFLTWDFVDKYGEEAWLISGLTE